MNRENVKSELTREDIIHLIEYLGGTKIKNREPNDNIQACCPVHGENTPSFGVSISKQTYHCFSCHSGGSLAWLCVQSNPDEFPSINVANKFIKEEYGVDLARANREWKRDIKRYGDSDEEDDEPKRIELPRKELAPFRSGGETYKYFFDRGFTKATMIEYMIGRDTKEETVTVPIFWEDSVLCGFIGRYIDPNRPKNSRYKIYGVPTSRLTYPQHKLEVEYDSIILVEGLLDALYMHQLGYRNTQALLTNNVSKAQAEFIKSKCNKVIDFTDNDEMGNIATHKIKEQLKGVQILSVKHMYPEGKKDPCDLDADTIKYMLANATNILKKKITRLT